MKFVNLKCSNCGGKLKIINNHLARCSSCQSEFIIDDEKNIVNNYIINNQTKQKKKNSSLMVILFVFVTTIIMAIVILGIASKDTVTNDSLNTNIKSETSAYREKPESEAGVAFVEQVFRKKIDNIQPEELKQLKYISVTSDVYSKNWILTYSFENWSDPFADFETKKIVLSEDLALHALDFTSFSELTYLDFNNTSDIEGTSEGFSLKNLDNLMFYGGDFNQSLDEIIDALPQPKKLKYLKVQIRNDNQLHRLQELTKLENLDITYLAEEVTIDKMNELNHLKSLAIDGYNLKDISWLSNFSKLTSLSLSSVSKISDYSSLYSLPNLENLSIKSGDKLNNIDFVKNMPKLKRLSLDNTFIHDIKDIANKETIISLHLTGNRQLNNIESISSLKNLKNLHFETYSDNVQATSLSNLEHLTEVTISADFLGLVEKSSNIKKLSIVASNELDLGTLRNMSSLEELIIKDVSDMINISTLSSLKNLKTFTLEKSEIDFDHNSEQIETMPSIKAFTLLDSRLSLGTLNQLPFPNLTYLKIDPNSSFSVRINDEYMHSSDYGLTLLPDKIKNMTNLENLIIPNSQLESLDFVTNFNKLKILDISNSHITDVTPLNQLKDLELLDIHNTPVKNIDILSSNVFIIK